MPTERIRLGRLLLLLIVIAVKDAMAAQPDGMIGSELGKETKTIVERAHLQAVIALSSEANRRVDHIGPAMYIE